MAGRVQILAKGHVSDQLLNNPSFSFFTKKISKYTNWSDETFKMSFNKDIHTGDFIDATIPAKYGDILKGVTLSFKVEDFDLVTLFDGPFYQNINNVSLVEKFGVSVIDYVELFLGDQLIDTVTGHDIFIYNELNTPQSQHGNLDNLQGEHFISSYSYGTYVQEWLDGQHQARHGRGDLEFNFKQEFRVHIPFYFHNQPKHGFPLYAVNKQELKLRTKLRPARELLFVDITSTYYDSGTLVNMPLSGIWNPMGERGIMTGQFKLDDFTVDLGLVHLDKSERCKLQSKPFNMLIEQHQYNKFYIEPRSKYGEFKLDFKNPIKEMYFIAKNDRPELDEPTFSNNLNQMRTVNMFAFSGVDGFNHWRSDIVYAKKPVPLFYSQQELVTLECDGVKILNEITGNSKFLAYSIPHIGHKRSPVGRRINVYSFALQPGKLEPSGHLDFSVIKDAKVTMSLTRDGSFGPSTLSRQVAAGHSPLYFFKEVRVIARSYNVIRFENGTGTILF